MEAHIAKKLVMGSLYFLKSLKCNIGKNLVMTILRGKKAKRAGILNCKIR